MIKIYDRNTKDYEIEKVAGEKYLNWIYSSPIGLSILELIVKKKLFSKLTGLYCDNPISKGKIKAFIKDFDIDMSICQDDVNSFKCFNDFFVRKITPQGRPVDMDKNSFISPGDGRLLIHENIDIDNLVQIKGLTYSFRELINDPKLFDMFQGGSCLILRLCPTDYHRFHFVDDGVCLDNNKVKGYYYSVNPVALNKKEKLFCQNKREWSLFQSDNFGSLLYMEVGATSVGSIVQSYTPNQRVTRGSEKGFFKFGGSTVMMFIEKNKVKFDEDILSQTEDGFESKIKLGEKIGTKVI
ncbi:phosphatidylserine decarboxylase [Clostridium sp. 19966]|uniref:phosphatidylserine decarboxylase n=1 Tax=Clostridium sp. 19966 TaxID=2768166 RepID=UPI0028DEAEC9|nr:phosphatidylserine decarboxylase [Clostridium sp. 19966]MDT8718591.1 phosphatidylserine decarboxylase [Clostridium sp. 19966]